MRKVLIGVMDLSLVVVPMLLMAWGIVLGTGPVWDALFAVGIITFAVFSHKRYNAVKRGEKKIVESRFFIALFGTTAAFFLLLLQKIFCENANMMALESAMGWLFWETSCSGLIMLYSEKTANKAITIALTFGCMFIVIAAIGVMFDLFVYFTGLMIPQFIIEILGVLAPITAIGCIISLVVGMLQDKLARRSSDKR